MVDHCCNHPLISISKNSLFSSLSKGPSQLVGKSETKVVKIFKEREREREREKIIIYISVMVDKGSISELRLFIDKFWGQIVKG